VQNLWLRAAPARAHGRDDQGRHHRCDLAAALPKAPADARTQAPTEAQSTAAGTLLGQKWATAVQ
jgi:putative spermidine/putrescine transport system substrate-binding protein